MFNTFFRRLIGVFGTGLAVAQPAAAACDNMLRHDFARLDGKPRSLCEFEGQVILVVNTASRCGFTSQYGGLEALYQRYRQRGFVILGFPSNDFAGQEPGSNQEIAEFCQVNYGVSFPMFAKTVVSGKNANPFYRQLSEVSGSTPKWNFHKYLIDRSGRRVEAFTSLTRPDDKALVARIETLLKLPSPTPPEKKQ